MCFDQSYQSHIILRSIIDFCLKDYVLIFVSIFDSDKMISSLQIEMITAEVFVSQIIKFRIKI